MQASRTFTLAALFSSILVLQGCGAMFNPVGEGKFDCNRRQDAKSPYCRSFKSAEASTEGDIPASRYDQASRMSDVDKLTGIAPDDAESAKPAPPPKGQGVLPHQVRLEQALQGAPVREGPVIQRTWVKRFVDANDLLTENTVVYKEIRGTRWTGFPVNGTPGSAGQLKLYPHRPVEPVKPDSKALDAMPASGNEFIQPGQSDVTESAPNPAASGSFNSMPK